MHYYKFKHNAQEITLETIIRGLDKPFYVSNAMKYLFRYGKKVPNPRAVEHSPSYEKIENLETMKIDLEKAKNCIEMEINELYNEIQLLKKSRLESN